MADGRRLATAADIVRGDALSHSPLCARPVCSEYVLFCHLYGRQRNICIVYPETQKRHFGADSKTVQYVTRTVTDTK